MGVKEIINRLYAYKDESKNERLNDLIDDTINLIIDLKIKLKGEPIRTKMYKLPSGQIALFDYDANGIGKVTVEAMDSIMSMIGAEPTGPTVKEEIKEEE